MGLQNQRGGKEGQAGAASQDDAAAGSRELVHGQAVPPPFLLQGEDALPALADVPDEGHGRLPILQENVGLVAASRQVLCDAQLPRPTLQRPEELQEVRAGAAEEKNALPQDDGGLEAKRRGLSRRRRRRSSS